MTSRIGVISPGAMGAAVAAASAPSFDMLWASKGRSPESRKRAADAGMTEVSDLEELIATSQVILSICPPSEAASVADEVIELGYDGIYVDANAIASGTARELDQRVSRRATFIDGGIIGPPPTKPGTTRMYLAGDGADEVASVFSDGPLDAIVLDGPPGAASALKTCYAANTKAGGALLMAIRALATSEGVDDALVREWEISQPHALQTSERWSVASAPKAWRFVGEMHEIGDALASADLPDGFLRAAADMYERLSDYKGSEPDLPLEDIIASVLRQDR